MDRPVPGRRRIDSQEADADQLQVNQQDGVSVSQVAQTGTTNLNDLDVPPAAGRRTRGRPEQRPPRSRRRPPTRARSTAGSTRPRAASRRFRAGGRPAGRHRRPVQQRVRAGPAVGPPELRRLERRRASGRDPTGGGPKGGGDDGGPTAAARTRRRPDHRRPDHRRPETTSLGRAPGPTSGRAPSDVDGLDRRRPRELHRLRRPTATRPARTPRTARIATRIVDSRQDDRHGQQTGDAHAAVRPELGACSTPRATDDNNDGSNAPADRTRALRRRRTAGPHPAAAQPQARVGPVRARPRSRVAPPREVTRSYGTPPPPLATKIGRASARPVLRRAPPEAAAAGWPY